MTKSEWVETGNFFAKVCCILFLFIQLNQPWTGMVGSPVWMPGFEYKQLLADLFWLFKFSNFIFAVFLVYKRKYFYIPIISLVFWVSFIFSPEFLFDFPDICSTKVDSQGNIYFKLGYLNHDKYKFIDYKINEREYVYWPRNKTFTIAKIYYEDRAKVGYCTPCYSGVLDRRY